MPLSQETDSILPSQRDIPFTEGRPLVCRDVSHQEVSLSQQRAQHQHRSNGRFAISPSGRGTSNSTRRRISQSQHQQTMQQRENNVRETLLAVMAPGDQRDFIPGGLKEGNLVPLIITILHSSYSIPSRNILALAKRIYLQRRKIKFMPRRDIRKNGVIVKRKAVVFSGVRFPDPTSPAQLSSLNRLLHKFNRTGMLCHPSLPIAIEAVTRILNNYDATKFEYEDYPLSGNLTTNLPPTTACLQSAVPLTYDPITISEQPCSPDLNIYVTRVECTALNDSEYLLLKQVLQYDNPTVLQSSVSQWGRVLSNLRAEGKLTRVEESIIDYVFMQDEQKRNDIGVGLQNLLRSLMEVRYLNGKELMLHIGYNPPESENTGSAVLSGSTASPSESS